MASIPDQIGKYRVLELLGRGGMGAVYKAEDAAIGRLVAIKVLLTEFENDDMLKRFYSEARSTGRLRHSNIVTLYDLGNTEGSPYLVMEFLEGESLDKVISSLRKLTLLEVLDIVRQVCSGLHYAHENQIIHRDVKPGNVVLLPDGQVKLVDFGIAKFGNDRQTRTGMAIGSVKYMSPEQISGADVDRRSDIYSTGVLLFEVLTRRLPFEGNDIVSTMHKVLTAPPPNLLENIPDAPPKLGEIIQTALAKDPRNRYQTADDLSYDLNALPIVRKRSQASATLTRSVPAGENGSSSNPALLPPAVASTDAIVPGKPDDRDVAVTSSRGPSGSIEKPGATPDKSVEDSDIVEWKKIGKSPTIPELDQFVSRFPHSPLRATAEGRRQDLMWLKAQNDGSLTALNDYLTAYPTGKYSQRAREEILRIDQRTIDTATNVGALEPLLTKYPGGDTHTRIVAKMDDLTWSQAATDPTRVSTRAWPR
jgi:serine/threonine protein kinase